jgi:hypothetical protein
MPWYGICLKKCFIRSSLSLSASSILLYRQMISSFCSPTSIFFFASACVEWYGICLKKCFIRSLLSLSASSILLYRQMISSFRSPTSIFFSASACVECMKWSSSHQCSFLLSTSASQFGSLFNIISRSVVASPISHIVSLSLDLEASFSSTFIKHFPSPAND